MPTGDDRDSPDPHPPSGVVELREDVPLKGVGDAGTRCCAEGPRFILACFAVLSAAITIALLTQIYYGDYEVVPHGSVSSSAAQCSRAGSNALKAGGRALDAAAVAALCLAVLAPHRTSLDASGSMLYWEYRQSRTQSPELFEWGGPDGAGGVAVAAGAMGAGGAASGERAPRLVAALAALHAQFGALPWSRVLQPAIDFARNGYNVSDGLALSMSTKPASAAPVIVAGTLTSAPRIATFLESLQANTSTELSVAWQAAALVRRGGARELGPGGTVAVARAEASGAGWRAASGGTRSGWRAAAGGLGAAQAMRALSVALDPLPVDADEASRRVILALQNEAASSGGSWPPAVPGVATGLAAVDRLDTYLALVTGTSVPFGSGPETAAGWVVDEPKTPLDLAPAIVVDDHICGTRYVVGAESSSALAQGVAALVGGGAGATAAAGVERARVAVGAGGTLALEVARPALPAAAAPAAALNATPPYAGVNVVLQRGDALVSHADSRGGGIAWRF